MNDTNNMAYDRQKRPEPTGGKTLSQLLYFRIALELISNIHHQCFALFHISWEKHTQIIQ